VLGYAFKTECDGEILPAAWQEWQEGMFAKLNGMFAIAIYEVNTAELVIARDHCGQKPLYYSMSGDFTFASEVRALKVSGVTLSPNRSAFAAYLMNRYVSEPTTLFNEVETLPAGHWARVKVDGVCSVNKFWGVLTDSENIKEVDMSLDDAVEKLEAETQRAVLQTMQSDWKSVLYLSSGVDSSMLAQYMHEMGSDVSTLSVGFESASDETSAAERFAKLLGFDHESIHLNADALDDLPRVVAQMERPVGDALILAFDALASGAKSLGAKVTYGAEGIDEHFGGYSFHQVYLKAQGLGSLGRWGAAHVLGNAPQSLIDRLANFPASLGNEGRERVRKYLSGFGTFSEEWQADYLRFLYEPSELSQVMEKGMAPDFSKLQGSANKLKLNELLSRQYDSWLQDWSLIRQDKNSMAHSIEYRSPFLDPQMVKFAFSLPAKWRMTKQKDKLIWRKLAEKKLPEKIAWRPKIPFYLPLEEEQWRKKLVDMSHDILSSDALAKHGWISQTEVDRLRACTDFLPLKKLAALVIFQLWYDQYF